MKCQICGGIVPAREAGVQGHKFRSRIGLCLECSNRHTIPALIKFCGARLEQGPPTYHFQRRYNNAMPAMPGTGDSNRGNHPGP